MSCSDFASIAITCGTCLCRPDRADHVVLVGQDDSAMQRVEIYKDVQAGRLDLAMLRGKETRIRSEVMKSPILGVSNNANVWYFWGICPSKCIVWVGVI